MFSVFYSIIEVIIMRINMISESEISVRGHGVHTAYAELTKALRARDDCDVIVNAFGEKTNADITHIHTIGIHALRKLFFGSGKKVVSAHVIPESLVGSIVLAEVWLPLARVYMSFFYKKADKVLAVSSMVADALHTRLGVPAEKIEVLYNSIDTAAYRTTSDDKMQARRKLNVKKDAFVVVGNGQIQPRKRFDTFVTIARQMPDVEFIWIGGIPFKAIGADYKHMQQLIETVPENVFVTGVIELEDVKKYLQAADVFLLPAEQENHPMAVIESASVGLPIILRDIPEYNDTFADDIVRCKNEKEFIGAITKLKDDKKFYELYQKKAQAIAKRFDSKAAAEKVVTIYKELIG